MVLLVKITDNLKIRLLTILSLAGSKVRLDDETRKFFDKLNSN